MYNVTISIVLVHTSPHPGSRTFNSHDHHTERKRTLREGNCDDQQSFLSDMTVCHKNKAISQSFLRKYLAHARASCLPRLHTIDQDKISCLYANLRRESAACGGVPIAIRHLESLMRMAEARVSTTHLDISHLRAHFT